MSFTQSAPENAELGRALVRRSLTQALAAAIGEPAMEIIELGGDGLEPQLDHRLCHEKKFVVLLVLELTQRSLPYLKYADCAIFFHAEQARLYRDAYGETQPHVVLDFLADDRAPITPAPTTLNLVLPHPFTPAEYQRQSLHLQALLAPQVTAVNLLSAADPQMNSKLIADVQAVIQPVTVQTVANIEQWIHELQTPGKTLVLQPESLSPYDMPNSEALIASNMFRLTDFCIRSRAYELATEILHAQEEKRATLIPQSICQEIRRTIKNKGKHKRESAATDALKSLNVVQGRPLDNHFVVSILYRNAGNKLLRAIDSVLRLAKGHDVGVALVDDCSTDNSLKAAAVLLHESNINAVVVQNLDRKYAARNYYNMIHQLTCNDDSIIIDLDGDDYLNTELNVFGTLQRAYADGHTLKTLGSYQLFSDAPQASLDRSEFYQSMKYFAQDNPVDFQQPWNIPTCPSWKHLRTSKRSLIRRVEIPYFMERSGTQWLRMEHDISVHSRAIELADGRVKTLFDKLYIYDVSGDNHDNHTQSRTKNSYIYKLFHAFTFNLESSLTQPLPQRDKPAELEIDFI